MKKTNEWKTVKGANIEMTTEHVTSKEIDLDGHKNIVKVDEIHVIRVTVNGKAVDRTMEFKNNGRNGLNLTVNNVTQLWLAIPEDIYESVWGDHNRRWEAGLDTRIAAETKYQENYDKVTKAMNEDELIK